MENRKKYYLTALICAVAAVLVIGISVVGRKPGEIDEMAASRGKEQEGEITCTLEPPRCGHRLPQMTDEPSADSS